MIKDVLIVGAGNIGYRHFQSLAYSGDDYFITVIDPDENCLSKIKSIKNQTKKISVETFQSISKINKSYDLAIIATNSNIRFSVVDTILNSSIVNNFILEKFLFSNTQEYEKTSNLLKKHKSSAWVNCPRRSWGIYKDIKKNLNNDQILELSVKGHDWGLASNGIHFIDLFGWLVESQRLVLDLKGIEKKIYQSKRKGVEEFYGIINGKVGSTDLVLNCMKGSLRDFIFSIKTKKKNIIIDEKKLILKEINLTNNHFKERNITIPFVSDTTAVFCKEILNNGSCDLPSFDESSNYHLTFLNHLIDKKKQIAGQTENSIFIT